MLEIAKVITKRFICVALNASLCVGTLGLAACNNQSPPNAPASSSTAPNASAPAPAGTASNAPSAYTPPSADQLYQLVAPIALFPDKLVAQVLAGSTYPDQITAADDLLAKNPNLKDALLQTAVDPQPWDPSVKGLTAFPSVLDQMAKNIQWTTALGTAYVNDPTDVMNAIQVMRQRASKSGSLVSNTKQRLVTTPVTATTTVTTQTETDYPPSYSGPEVVPAPQETIQIEPAESDVVYVPSYNPQTVYGDEVAYYPGYAYSPGYAYRPGYSTGDVVVAGAIGFGAGILIANLFDHHDNHSWGWNSWGMRWGGGGGYNGGGYNGGGWGGRPAVVHNDNVYVSHSNTVINRYTTNNVTNNNRYINNSVNNSNNNNNNNNNNRENFNRTVQNNNPNNPNNPNADNRRFDPRENPANRAAGPEAGRAPNTLRPGPVSQAMAQPRPEARGPMTTPNFQNALQRDQHIQAMRGGATPAQQAALAGQPHTAAAEAARTSQRMQPFDGRQQQANEARARQEGRIENTPRENPGAQRLPVAPSFHAAAPEAARQQQPRQDMEQQQRAAMQQQQRQAQQERQVQQERQAQQAQQERQVQQARPEPQQQRVQQERREMPQQQPRMEQPRQEQHAPPAEHHAAPEHHAEPHGDKKDDNHHR